ncbi:putative protein S-acyltransferase 15 [Gossypium australe]|uniref:Uncharacterized protein n=1 Tax=Gossypium australe TaxID=47621 RepID=A0A5B6WK53_9ROSI|nr:putative protein S-acyltransferase 15 [Gossypium australe]
MKGNNLKGNVVVANKPSENLRNNTPAQVLKLVILLVMLMLPILITLMGSSLPNRHDCFRLERKEILVDSNVTSAGSLNSMIFTTLACLCALSFLVGVLTDPGRVPSSYIPDVEDTFFASDQEPKKNRSKDRLLRKRASTGFYNQNTATNVLHINPRGHITAGFAKDAY